MSTDPNRGQYIRDMVEQTGLPEKDVAEAYDLARHHLMKFLDDCSGSRNLFSGATSFAAYTLWLSFFMQAKVDQITPTALAVARIFAMRDEDASGQNKE